MRIVDIRELNIALPQIGTVLDRGFRYWPTPRPGAAAMFGIVGPPGSGKTRMFLTKGLVGGMAQPPSRNTGDREFAMAVFHITYRQLWRGPIATWHKIVPKDVGEWSGGEDQPATHRIGLKLTDGTTLRFIAKFLAYAGETVEDTLRGVEYSYAFPTEVDLHPEDALFWLGQRAGRYPDQEFGGPWWYGVCWDANSPVQNNYLARKMQRQWVEGVHYLRQPPAVISDGMGGWQVNPRAENLKNLPPGYYENQLADAPDWFIRRMLALEFGFDRSGLPVYLKDYNDLRHCAKRPIDPIPELPLVLGADAGGSPALIFCQDLPSGQFRVIDELVAEQGTGVDRFGEDILKKLQAPPFNGRWSPGPASRDFVAGADPSATFGKDRKTGKGDWLGDLSQKTGIEFRAAGPEDNALLPRIESLRRLLRKPDVMADVPAFLISPVCGVLREALNGKYRYRRKEKPGEAEYDPDPEKNPHSHPTEALQYAIIVARGIDGRSGLRTNYALPGKSVTTDDAVSSATGLPPGYRRGVAAAGASEG